MREGAHLELFHFTSWDPTALSVGQIVTISWSASHYWEETLSGRKVDSQAIPIPSVPGLPTCVLEPTLRRLRYSSEVLKELAFENVRREEFPGVPSRSCALFGVVVVVDPEVYAHSIGFDPDAYTLLRMVSVEGLSTILRTDLDLLDCNLLRHPEMESKARLYWSGLETPTARSELLVTGSLKILEIRARP